MNHLIHDITPQPYADWLASLSIGCHCSLAFLSDSDDLTLHSGIVEKESAEGGFWCIRFRNDAGDLIPVWIAKDAGYGAFLASPVFAVPRLECKKIKAEECGYPLAAMNAVLEIFLTQEQS